MKLFNLTRHPLVKWSGILAILYFALFSNKDNPRSLGNRMSSENIEKSLREAKEKSDYIIENVKIARSLAGNPASQPSPIPQISSITTQDLNIGSGDLAISCGNEAVISYAIYKSDATQVEFVNSQELVIGSKSEPFLEENILGMKLGGIRSINILTTSSISDQKIIDLMKKHGPELKIQVTLLSLLPTEDKNLFCK
jgi:hypothetical protein